MALTQHSWSRTSDQVDLEQVVMCDVDATGAVTAKFIRHFKYVTDHVTAATVASVLADTALDGVTAYVVAGTASLCAAVGNETQVAPIVTAVAAGATHNTTAGARSVSVTNLGGSVTVAGAAIPEGFTWSATADWNGANPTTLAAIAIVVGAASAAIVTELPSV